MNIRLTFLASFALSLFCTLGLAFAEEAYFERDTLNAGLGEPPTAVDRSTPRATVESLLRLTDGENAQLAGHLLDLSDIPEAEQSEVGGGLANKLRTVIERKIVLSWGQLVDRPDGFDASESSRAATAGMPRKSLKLWELDVGAVPTAIRLERIRPGSGDPVWVFSRRTVEDIDALYNEFGPSRFERKLPNWLREESTWGLMRWEFIGFPLLLFLAGAAGWAVHRSVRHIRKRANRDIVKQVIQATSKPLTIATVTTVLWWGVSTVFVFSGRLDAILSPLVAIGFVTALLMLVLSVFEAALDKFVGFEEMDLTERQEAEQRDTATRIAAIRRILAVVVFIVGAGIVLSMANVFQTLGYSILASAGALTLILGFAARRVLGNIIASLQIALNHSARIGDRVVYKDQLCHVERINFTFVQLRDWKGTRLVVPVEEFISETFENWTLKEPEMLRILKFKLNPDVDMEALRSAFDEVIASLDQDELDDTDKVKVVVTGQDVFGIDVWFYVPCADPNTSWDLACEAREKLIARMNELHSDEARVFPEATAAEAA